MRTLRLSTDKIFCNSFTVLGCSCPLLFVYSANYLQERADRPLCSVHNNHYRQYSHLGISYHTR